jgi:hypothetical protein
MQGDFHSSLGSLLPAASRSMLGRSHKDELAEVEAFPVNGFHWPEIALRLLLGSYSNGRVRAVYQRQLDHTAARALSVPALIQPFRCFDQFGKSA